MEKKEILFGRNNLDDMAARIAKAERGIFDDDEAAAAAEGGLTRHGDDAD